jgi:hypothetical protein
MKLRGQQGWCDNVVASMLVGYIVWHFMIFFSLSLFIDLQSLVKNRKFDLMRICNHVEKRNATLTKKFYKKVLTK